MIFNWHYIQEVIPLYKRALLLTIRLAFWGIFFSFVLGLVCSFIMFYKLPVLKTIVKGYVELSRNTPLLVQLYFLYYGFPKIGMVIPQETCAVIGLTFLGGSYMTEAIRSGLEAIPTIQVEIGESIGLSKYQIIRYVMLPQAFALSIPAVGANCIFLLKETSVFSSIAIMDLMNTTRDLIGMNYRTNEYLLMLVVSYGIVLIPISIILTLLERRVRHGAFGN